MKREIKSDAMQCNAFYTHKIYADVGCVSIF